VALMGALLETMLSVLEGVLMEVVIECLSN
jgi:hypothetical protein